MNATLEQVKPETLAIVESNAKQFGLSIDDYLRSLLPSDENDMSLKSGNENELEADMMVFAEEIDNSLNYNGTYSREDVYFDHD